MQLYHMNNFLPNGYCMLRKDFQAQVLKNLACEMMRRYVTK